MSNIKKTCLNRRQLLSIVNSIYDPLGFLAPIILPTKILKQLCHQKLAWDDHIDAQSLIKFHAWIDEINQLRFFYVNRCVKPCDFVIINVVEFHHFSDALEDAYSSVSYIRLINESSECHTSILLAKCRLIPISTSTIPRLELNAATMSVKNENFLRKEMQFSRVHSYFWTDITDYMYQFCGTSGMNLVLSKRLLLIALLLFEITLVCLNGFMCLALLIQQIKQLEPCLQRSFSSACCEKTVLRFCKVSVQCGQLNQIFFLSPQKLM